MLIMQGNGLVMLKLKITDLSTAQLLFIVGVYYCPFYGNKIEPHLGFNLRI